MKANPETQVCTTGTKKHYEILDGLRGVAAVIIVIYHLFEGCGVHLGHGYLGVDFFYALSGFVIAYAYDDRWGKLSLKTFFRSRIIRLHPMVLLGTTIGFVFYYFGESPAFQYIGERPWWMVVSLFVYCCFMLPMPNAWDLRGWQDFNSFNGNIWSLTWEYAANILYAFIFRFLPTTVLGVLLFIAALGTIDLTFNIDIFGVFAAKRVGEAFTVNGGWSLTVPELYVGAVRVLFPFLAGMLLARIKKYITVHGAFILCSLAIAGLFLLPPFKGVLNAFFEAGVILFVIPLILAVGAGSKIENVKLLKACDFLGQISYPLYITHLPLVYMQIAWLSQHPESTVSSLIIVSVSLFFASLALGYASLKLYDLPVRAYLQKHWK